MKVIKPARIREYWRQHRRARPSLEQWLERARSAQWRNLTDARRTFSSADAVRVASGKTVTVFNIAGNNYRLVTAVHYNMGKIFVLRFLTHAQYDKQSWKESL